MQKEKFPNATPVQLILAAWTKLRVVEAELEQYSKTHKEYPAQLRKVRYTCELLHEARMVLSASELPPEAAQEQLPF